MRVHQTYINGEVLSLIRLLLIGSDVTDLEQVLADDCDNSLAKSRARLTETRDRCRLNQLSLVCGPLEQLQVSLSNLQSETQQ